jgi:hypothetical protein
MSRIGPMGSDHHGYLTRLSLLEGKIGYFLGEIARRGA